MKSGDGKQSVKKEAVGESKLRNSMLPHSLSFGLRSKCETSRSGI